MSDRKPNALLGGADDELLFERASATPSRAIEKRHAARVVARESSTPVAASLAELQRWVSGAIMHVGSLEEAASSMPHAIERVLAGHEKLSVVDRLGVYHFGYRARLVECLADDYPIVQHAMGEAAFEALCHVYVAAHPSRSPSLNAFGRRMPGFLRERRDGFLADLAALEWALVEAIHAAEAPTLSIDALRATPPDRWAGARLPKAETTRLLRFDHPVNGYLQKVRTEGDATIPDAAPSATIVYRSGFTLWRMDLTPAMARVLEALFGGGTLAEALEKIEADETDAEAIAEAERNVMAWFQAWVAGGVFATIDVG